MDNQNQTSFVPSPTPQVTPMNKVLIVAFVLGILLLISLAVNIYQLLSVSTGPQTTELTPATTTTTQEATYASPIQSVSDLNSTASALDNTDPSALGSGLSQNDTDASSF